MAERKNTDTNVLRAQELKQVQAEATNCRRCELYKHATQTVFGRGPVEAKVMLVGEQPGDREDIEGQPFVGPAGQLLRKAVEEAGLRAEEIYITNAVKHFKFLVRGKRRIHQKPKTSEVAACHLWLRDEIELVAPEVIVCLGATAAQALLGSTFRLTANRGAIIPGGQGTPDIVATYHPSAVLRVPSAEARAEMYAALVTDLRTARRHLSDAEPDARPAPHAPGRGPRGRDAEHNYSVSP